jgi:nucleoside-diphosphate-sugar epimerase
VFNNKNVLVAGSAGLAGHEAVQQLLDRGAFVRATVFNSPGGGHRGLSVSHPRLEIVPCDLSYHGDATKVVRDMDMVINCAASICGAKGQTENPWKLIRENLVPYINLIEAACVAGVDRFAFIGSSTMYPDRGFALLQEHDAFVGDPPLSYQGFGWMKRYCEKLCQNFHRITKTNFALIRTSAIYGPHASFDPDRCHVVPATIIKAHDKLDPFPIWGDGTQKRDFIYVSDLIDGLLRVLEVHAEADPINIGTGVGSSIDELVRIVLTEYDYSPHLEYCLDKPGMAPMRVLNVSKAHDVLKWSSKVILEEGIAKTVSWYKRLIENV